MALEITPRETAPLRIALVSDSFAGDFDERAQAARHLVDAWIDAGHAPTVLTASAGTNSYRGADVWRVRGLRGRGKRLRSALLQVAPDVVVALSPDEFGRKALKQAVRLGLATVVIEQRPVPSYLPEYYHEQVIGRADRLVVTSDWVRARLAERGVAAQVWRPGVDLTAYHPELRDPTLHRHWTKGTKLAVGYAGELRKREGVRRLAGLSSIPFVQPVFIGAGPQRTWLRTNASGVFTNPRDTGALGTALASLDVLVHPSRRLTDAPLVRAALASAVPVVVPGPGRAAEFVRHDQTGLHFDRNEALGLVAAVSELAANADRRAEIGLNARAWSLTHSWQRAADRLVDDHLRPAAATRRAAADAPAA